MWCLSCFKPSTSEVTFEAEIDLALEVSREEADSQEAKQLASAIEESSRLHKRQEEAEKMRRRELEKDAQIARSFQYDEREMKLDNEEEQPAKTVVESLKDKGKTTVQFDEQVNKDAELALILQESLNMVKPPRRTEERKSIPPRAVLDVEEQLPKAVKKSSKEKGKRKKIEGEQVKKDDELAVILQESLNMVEPPPPPRLEERKSIPRRAALDVEKQLSKKAVKKSSKEKGKGKQIEAEQVKKDKELALILQESLNVVEPPRRTKEHKRRARELENDAQIARALQYDERERGLDNNSALEDETYGQPDKIVVESFQDKVKVVKFEEQVKTDEQIAQDLQNRFNKMAFEESPGLHDNAVLDDKDEKLAKTAKSSKEKRKSKQFEEQVNKDEQVAQDLQNLFNKRSLEESPRLHDNAMFDGKVEQLGKIASSKEKRKSKQFEEQVKNDEQIAQDLQNQLSEIAYKERTGLHDNSVLGNEDEQFPKTVGTSFKLKGKEKILEDEQVKKDEELAARIHESLNMHVKKDEELASRSSLDEEEQRLIWESLKGKGIKELTDEVEENGKLPEMNPPRIMCGGCNSEIEHGRSVDVLGVLWHPECLWCDACHKPITVQEVANHVSNSRGKFHKACYERYCYVCKERKMKKFHQHPFWEERYCPAHDSDGTPKCFSCERLEPRGTNYVKLGDRRWQCLECMESAVMDTYEALPLHFEIREFFEGLNMKIEKEFPFLLVEKQALNKAEEEEKIDYQYEVVTRGICLSEAQTVTSVSKRPRMGQHNQLIDMVTETQRVVSDCEVTAILILYGLPRLMTGYILAHEMMHAYLRLNGYRNLNTVIEEGICQVLGHIWLESQTYAPIDATTEAAASSSNNPAATASKKGICSDFEKKLVDFCKNQIETDDSPVYGVGFRKVNKMVSNSSLKETLKEIVRRG